MPPHFAAPSSLYWPLPDRPRHSTIELLWAALPRPIAAATARLNHCEIFDRLFSGELQESIYSGGYELLALPVPSGRALSLRLEGCGRFRDEGELMLTLCDRSSGLMLASVPFSFTAMPSGDAMWIGGVHGYAGPCTRQVSEEVSRELHGLQPAALAVWCLRELAGHWALQQIRAADAAVGNELWREAGGRPAADGQWDLPPPGWRCWAEHGLSARRKGHEQRRAVLASIEPRLLAATTAPGAKVR